MRKRLIWATFWAIIGCGAEGEPIPSPPDLGITPAEFAARLSAKVCSGYETCCTQREQAFIFSNGGGAECGGYPALIESERASIEAGISHGGLSYDGIRARACVEAFEAKGCDTFLEDYARQASFRACDGLSIPHVPRFEACVSTAECQEGASCIGVAGESTCAPNLDICHHQPCLSDELCVPNPNASARECRPLVAAGGACTDRDQCRSRICGVDRTCKDDVGCNGDPSDDHTQLPLAACVDSSVLQPGGVVLLERCSIYGSGPAECVCSKDGTFTSSCTYSPPRPVTPDDRCQSHCCS